MEQLIPCRKIRFSPIVILELKSRRRINGRLTLTMSGFFIVLNFFLLFSTTHGSSDGILASCHTLFPNQEGVIKSPNFPEDYPNNLDCILDIVRPHDDETCGIRLTLEQFNLEPADRYDGFCKKDWLAIDYCVPEGGSRFCGSMSPATYEYPFQIHAEAFRIIFHSDNETTSSGYKIKYKMLTNCQNGLYWDQPISTIPGIFPRNTPCFTQVTEKKGTINSPYFPRNYPHNMDCVYEFVRETPFICGIRMRVLSFELDKPIQTQLGGACLDFFHTPGCGFLCGSLRFVWTAKFQPGAVSLRFHFHSDEKKTRPGFQIAFEQVYSC